MKPDHNFFFEKNIWVNFDEDCGIKTHNKSDYYANEKFVMHDSWIIMQAMIWVQLTNGLYHYSLYNNFIVFSTDYWKMSPTVWSPFRELFGSTAQSSDWTGLLRKPLCLQINYILKIPAAISLMGSHFIKYFLHFTNVVMEQLYSGINFQRIFRGGMASK